ncbi:MAG TPA: hypothetical protein VFX16_33400 [Pseudonocardiaceae bacterium]|nr:hypothetical protein [Pseudonocardiaceae bacterium]
MTSATTHRWLGYIEEHELTDTDRRAEGRAARLANTPAAVLSTPDEVAQWITAEMAHQNKRADEDARQVNGLMGDRSSVNRSVAVKGSSVYATVRISSTITVDLCAEIQASDGCSSPARARLQAEQQR